LNKLKSKKVIISTKSVRKKPWVGIPHGIDIWMYE
jgi:hypothetical protein